jgi:hypothetical protein
METPSSLKKWAHLRPAGTGDPLSAEAAAVVLVADPVTPLTASKVAGCDVLPR